VKGSDLDKPHIGIQAPLREVHDIEERRKQGRLQRTVTGLEKELRPVSCEYSEHIL
jgi:hypothetical protein